MGSPAAQDDAMNRTRIAVLLALGFAVMLTLNLPGQMSYDSVSQLFQGRTGAYNSWHPPVMAWLLGLFDAVWPGTALFVLFDAALLAFAWAMVLKLGRRPGWDAFAVLLATLLLPQFVLHQGTVWKDVLFTDSAIAAFVALTMAAAQWKARGAWLALCAILLTLASLSRQNGLVLVPAAAVGLGWIAARHEGRRRGIAYGVGGLLLPLALIVSSTLALDIHGDGGAGAAAEVERAQLYDLIGALKQNPDLPLPVLDRQQPNLSRLMRSDGVRVYQPMLVDTLEKSDALIDAASATPASVLFAQWKSLVLDHPGFYIAERWPVFVWTVAPPDVALCHPAFAGVEGDPDLVKALGLTSHVRPRDHALAAYARAFMGTPALSHLTFVVLALGLLITLLWRRRDPDIAVAAMLGGALVFTLTFFFISLACDYRYLDFLDLAAMSAGFYWTASRR